MLLICLAFELYAKWKKKSFVISQSGEIGYISVQVEGKPAPTFKFYYKGVTPLLEGIRYKFHTDGETNTITLCIRNIKTSDEGKYKIVITNSHGTFSDETQLYVSKPGCTDFRTLLRKSKYAKWGKDKGDPNWGDLKGVQKVSIFFVFNQNLLNFSFDWANIQRFFFCHRHKTNL